MFHCSQQGVRDEPLYGVVDVSREIEEDKVYGRLVDFRPSLLKVIIGCTHAPHEMPRWSAPIDFYALDQCFV